MVQQPPFNPIEVSEENNGAAIDDQSDAAAAHANAEDNLSPSVSPASPSSGDSSPRGSVASSIDMEDWDGSGDNAPSSQCPVCIKGEGGCLIHNLSS